ncbi:MAG TPA: proline racemase family protein [Gemmatimonadaceae bacterium]|nr:proline racemase family protein [Gemmatimonadaceae bacterium]
MMPSSMHVVDSHTEGEPTRVIIGGWPQPAGQTMATRRQALREHADHLRRAAVCEPRGHEALVGALLTPPVCSTSTAGIIFFNSRTYLGMCGHGLIGVVQTLAHLGRIGEGRWRFDTPAGTVSAELHASGEVTVENVAASCHALNVEVAVPEIGPVRGDVAYGGNWFFLTHSHSAPLELAAVTELTREAGAIQRALRAHGIRGADGEPVDHVEFSGPPTRPDADARNFVLCSSGEYDRSPCGTGTSAVMAVLHARDRLPLGALWRQEGITGGVFNGWLESGPNGELLPRIRARAFITAESTLLFSDDDPFRDGFGE